MTPSPRLLILALSCTGLLVMRHPSVRAEALVTVTQGAPVGTARQSVAREQALRFPQPVRVGDLIGRQMLQPTEAEHVLGHVLAIRKGDDRLELVLRTGGVLGLATRQVAVPLAATALLGQYMVLVDIPPDELARLPTDAGAGPVLGNNEIISVGIVKPYH